MSPILICCRCFYNCPGDFAPSSPDELVGFRASDVENKYKNHTWKWEVEEHWSKNLNLSDFMVPTYNEDEFIFNPSKLDFKRDPNREYRREYYTVKVKGVCSIY